jgi:hypothetical protein
MTHKEKRKQQRQDQELLYAIRQLREQTLADYYAKKNSIFYHNVKSEK